MNEDIKEIIEAVRDSYNETMPQKEFNCYVDMLENCIKYLQERIDKAINKMQYIRDLGFDYDGFNNADDLKGLIDTLVDLAEQSIDILKGENENIETRKN